MNVTIVGGGNLAHALVALLGNNNNINISIFTSKPTLWSSKIEGFENNKLVRVGEVDKVSNLPEIVIKNANIILFTVPAFIREDIVKQILPFVDISTILGSFPGIGGFDLIINKYLPNNIYFSSQRVPYICRILEYGNSVLFTRKDSIKIVVNQEKYRVQKILQNLLNMNIELIDDFLEVNLSNSNPILHSARMYSLFRNYYNGLYWKNEILFYEDWNDDSSKILLELDGEFQLIIKKIDKSLSSIISLKEHYEVDNYKEMTKKISSIKAFKGIKTPMINKKFGYIPDFDSRYFKEDITFGLLVIQQYAKRVKVKIPLIDRIIIWSHKFMNSKYIKNNLGLEI